jgi:hypothetical protein
MSLDRSATVPSLASHNRTRGLSSTLLPFPPFLDRIFTRPARKETCSAESGLPALWLTLGAPRSREPELARVPVSRVQVHHCGWCRVALSR